MSRSLDIEPNTVLKRSNPETESERRAKKRRNHDVFGGEYSVVALRISWGLLSIACFIIALPSRYWVRWLPFQPDHNWFYPWWVVRAMGILAAAGTFCAIMGLFFAERKTASKIGLATNGLVLLLVGLTFLGMRLIANR